MPIKEMHILHPQVTLQYVEDAAQPGHFQVQEKTQVRTSSGLHDSIITVAPSEVPRILFNAMVDVNGAQQAMDVLYTHQRIYFRYVVDNAATGNTETIYCEIDPTQDVPQVVAANSDGQETLAATFESGYRLHDKLDALHSTTLKMKLLNILPTDDASLFWLDIRKINELLAVEIESDPTKKAEQTRQLLEQLNELLRHIGQRYHLTDEQQVQLQMDDAQFKRIRREAQRLQTLVGLDNHYLFDLFKTYNIRLNDKQIIQDLHHFLADTPGLSPKTQHHKALQSPNYRLLAQQMTNFLQSKGLCHSDGRPWIVTENEMQQIHQGQVELHYISQIRNPYLRHYVHQYCPRLKKNAQGLLDCDTIEAAIKQFNDTQAIDQLDLALIAEGLPCLVQETPKLTTDYIPFTTVPQQTEEEGNIPSEMINISTAQRNLTKLDRLIANKIPALKAPLLDLFEHDALCTLAEDSQHPALSLRLASDEIINETVEAIVNDMRNGANLYEALENHRLANLLEYDDPLTELPKGISKEQLQTRREKASQLDKVYRKALEKIHATTKQDCNIESVYFSFNDATGNFVSLRVQADSDPKKPGRLLVLVNPAQYFSQEELALTTLLQPDHMPEPNQRLAYGSEKCRERPLWSAADQCWYQWHWCARTGKLGRIAEDGSKNVFYFDHKNQRWQRDSAKAISQFSWPSAQFVFPQRPPVTLRDTPPPAENAKTFTDEKSVTTYLRDAEQQLAKHRQRFQPENLAKHLKTLPGILPAADSAYISQTQKLRLEEALAVLPSITDVVTEARNHLLAKQDEFHHALATSLDTQAHFELLMKQQPAIQKLYDGELEKGIQLYTDMLSSCNEAKSNIENALANAKLGVQTTLSGKVDKVNVDFGDAPDSSQFVNNEPSTRVEERKHQVQTSRDCTVEITTTLHKTNVAFPKEAQELDYLEGFQRGAEFSRGQLPIVIYYNEKNSAAKKAAETLRDAALLYLKDLNLDPMTYLYINDKAYKENTLGTVGGEHLKQVQSQWLQNSPRAQRQALLNKTVNSLQDVARKLKPKSSPQLGG